MGFLKKIFRRRKRKKQEEQKETWYNNSQEMLDRGMGELPMDPGSLAGESSIYIPTAKQLNH